MRLLNRTHHVLAFDSYRFQLRPGTNVVQVNATQVTHSQSLAVGSEADADRLDFAFVFLPLVGLRLGETELVYKFSGIEMPGSHAAIAHCGHSQIGTGSYVEGEDRGSQAFHAYVSYCRFTHTLATRTRKKP